MACPQYAIRLLAKRNKNRTWRVLGPTALLLSTDGHAVGPEAQGEALAPRFEPQIHAIPVL
jgi:hypothetical protein